MIIRDSEQNSDGVLSLPVATAFYQATRVCVSKTVDADIGSVDRRCNIEPVSDVDE